MPAFHASFDIAERLTVANEQQFEECHWQGCPKKHLQPGDAMATGDYIARRETIAATPLKAEKRLSKPLQEPGQIPVLAGWQPWGRSGLTGRIQKPIGEFHHISQVSVAAAVGI